MHKHTEPASAATALMRQRVHPEDVDRLAAWVAETFDGGERSIE